MFEHTRLSDSDYIFIDSLISHLVPKFSKIMDNFPIILHPTNSPTPSGNTIRFKGAICSYTVIGIYFSDSLEMYSNK